MVGWYIFMILSIDKFFCFETQTRLATSCISHKKTKIYSPQESKIPLPFLEICVWFWSFSGKSSESWRTEEAKTGDSAFASSRGGGVSTTTDEKLNESHKRRRTTRPTKKIETPNFTHQWLCFCRDNGPESDLTLFTILCQKQSKKMEKEPQETLLLLSHETVLLSNYYREMEATDYIE